MFCRFCGERINDDALFCGKCGARVAAPTIEAATKEKTGACDEASVPERGECGDAFFMGGDARTSMSDNSYECEGTAVRYGQAAPSYFYEGANESEAAHSRVVKPSGAVKWLLFSGYIAGLLGITMFLVLSIINLCVYGDVLLFGDDESTICSSIGLVLVVIGIVSVFIRLGLARKYPSDKMNLLCARRVLSIILCFVCFAMFVWSFVDLGHGYTYRYNYDYGTGGSSYTSSTDSVWDGKTVNFYALYNACDCASPWATYGVDYLKIDTNPYDYDSNNSASTTYLVSATNAIKRIHSKLDLPTYLYDEMLNTTGADGKRNYSGTKVDVTWRYYPSYGLEVWYKQKSQ